MAIMGNQPFKNFNYLILFNFQEKSHSLQSGTNYVTKRINGELG